MRKLERTIEAIKMSSLKADERNFAFFWGRLQQLLVEERENAEAIELTLKGKKQPKAAPAAPAKSTATALSAAATTKATPKPKADPPKNTQKGEKGKSEGHMTPEDHVCSTKCRTGVFTVTSVHTFMTPQRRPIQRALIHAETKPKAKPVSKPAAKPKAMAAVALVAALSSMVSPVQGLLEFAADSGAGRHLVSHEALAQQRVDSSVIQPFLRPSHESIRFHIGGGQRDSNLSLGFQAVENFSDANYFVLPGYPFVRSIGQDVADGMSFVWMPGELPFMSRRGPRCLLTG